MSQINVQRLGDLKKGLPEMKPGDTIKVSEKILEKSKKKSQVFEGILISRKHGKGINATFTLRTVIGGVGVEKTYPLHSPLIEKIQIIKKGKSRRAKLYYLRKKTEKEIKRKLKSQRILEERLAIEKKREEARKKKETEREEKKDKELEVKKEEMKGKEEKVQEKIKKAEAKEETAEKARTEKKKIFGISKITKRFFRRH